MTGTEALERLLSSRDDVRLAYVFGSVAAGAAGPASDLDVAILFAETPEPAALDRLSEDLEEAGGRSIDLVDLAEAPPLLAHQIIGKGRCIVCRDPQERAAFETKTVLRYLDTAHLRAIQHEYLRKRAETRS